MARVRSSGIRGALSRRIRSVALVTALLTSTFLALALSQDGSMPSSPGSPPTATILSPFAVLEPSTRNNPNDKDGYPPTQSEADPEEVFMLAQVTTDHDVYDANATLAAYPVDGIQDMKVDDDTPRNLDVLDGVADGKLAAGSYFLYWNLNKTGYVPVNTSAGSDYNGSNSASISIVNDVDAFQLDVTYSETAGGALATVSSDLYTVQMDKSSGVNQNDLSWIDTEPKVVFAGVGETFTVRSKYQQSSAQGLNWLILESYFNGMFLRINKVSLYLYNDHDPGSIVDAVPTGWDARWDNQQQFSGADLGSTDNKDFWVTEYTYQVRQVGFSDLIPYIQTKKGGDSWKVDGGYRNFNAHVPGGVNPAVLNVTKALSGSFPGGVVSGPNPPVVGQTTTYELNITVENTGADVAKNVVVTDVVQLADVTWLDEYTVTQGTVAFDPDTGTISWSVGSLVVNASARLSYRVSVTPEPADADTCILLNAGASVAGTSGGSGEFVGGGPTPGICSAIVAGVPAMTITKTANTGTANPGDEITYTLHYANTGSAAAENVVVEDTIPDHVTYVSSDPPYTSVTGRTYSWDVGTVDAGASGDITLVVQVDAGTADGTVLSNLGTVEYTNTSGEPQPPGESGTNVTVTAPVMTFSKTADVTVADPGDLITYTLAYANTGTGEATGVTIQDTIPEHVTFVSATPTPSSVSGRTYTFDLGTVAGGASGTVTIVVRVDAGTPDGTDLTNAATLDHDDANGNPYPQESGEATTTVTAPVMTFSKTADVSTANPGDVITYTLTAKNTGTGGATGVVLHDAIPDHATFLSADPAYDDVVGRTYEWDLGTLAAGQTKVVTLKVTVDAGTADGTVLTNAATLDYGDANGNPYPQLSDSASTTVTAPVVTFAKVADVAYADPGDEITYTLTAHNAGTGAASDLVVVDTIPENVTFVSASPTYTSVSGLNYTWDLGTLAAGGTAVVTLTVRVNASVADGTVLTNVAVLDYDDANGNPYPQESDSASTTVTAPVMTFSKTADVAYADPGDEITYTLAYHNGGTGWATGVVVKDTLPDHVTYVSSNPAYDSMSGRTYEWDVGDVGPGAGDSITVTVRVDVGTPDGTILGNVATLDSADANGNPEPQLNDGATTTVTAPVMTFSKTADVAYADPGDLITYTLAYQNVGGGEATGVVIKDTVPEHVTFVSSDPAYTSADGRTYEWDVGTVGAGASGSITLVVRVDVGTADRTILTNTATLDYDDANGNPYDQMSDSATTTVTAPVVTFSKTADVETGTPGDLVTYTLAYGNAGSGGATLVVIVDTLPDRTTFVDATPYPDTVSGNVLTWTIGDLGPGASDAITVEARIDVGTADGTVLHNAATLDYADANGNAYPALEGSADVTVLTPVMSFAKNADVTSADPGDLIVYTLGYENSGGGAATGVTVVDTLPTHVTFVSATPDPTTVDGNVLTWDVGTVAAHTSDAITVTVRVDAYTDDGTFLVNAATFDYEDANGNPYPQLSDTAEVTVTAPVVTFTKVADVTRVDPGGFITYTLAYANTGSGAATGVVVRDTIPEHVTFVSSDPPYDSVVGSTYTWEIGDLAAGASGTITIVVQVDAGTPDATLLHNAATLDYGDANGNPYPALPASADVTVTAPVVDLTKIANVSTADPGDEITYTLTFTNSGSGNATDVSVNDTIPSQVTFVSSTPDYAGVDGRAYTWHWDLVLPGDSVTVEVVVRVDAYVPDRTLLHNVATTDYRDANGNAYPTLTAYADVVVTAPVFTFSKTANAATGDPGDLITYTLAWENTGTGWATGVTVRDTLPDHVDLVSTSIPPTDFDGTTLTFVLGDFPPTSSGHVFVTVRIQAYTPDQTLLHNAATFDFDDANGNPYPTMRDYADVVVTAPVMTFSKTGDVSAADPGDPVTYTVCYANTGTGAAGDVVVTDVLPDHATFVSATPAPSGQVGNTLTWDVGVVPGGDSACIEIVVEVDAGTPDRTLLHNAATLDYADANGNAYPALDAYWDVRVTAPVFTFAKTANVETADPGDIVMYRLVWENTGSGWATSVRIVDTLPDDVTFVSSTPPPTELFGTTFVLLLGDIAPGATGQVTVTVRVNAGTPDRTLLHNAATLDYSDANGNFVESLGSSADVTVTAPVMTFDKTAGDVTVSAYIYANFTLRIAGEKWHDVRLIVHDRFGSHVLASITRYPGDPDDQSVTVYNVRIDILNPWNATIVYTPEDDPINGQPWGDNPCWLTMVFQDGSSVRLKHNFNVRHPETYVWTIDDFKPYLGGKPIVYEATIPYTLSWANVGTGDASNVYLNDTFPAGSVFLDASVPYDYEVGGVYTWILGVVPAGATGAIYANVSIVFDVNNTVVVNTATLDYSDANGNFVEELNDSASSILVKPVILGLGRKTGMDPSGIVGVELPTPGGVEIGAVPGPVPQGGPEVVRGTVVRPVRPDVAGETVIGTSIASTSVGTAGMAAGALAPALTAGGASAPPVNVGSLAVAALLLLACAVAGVGRRQMSGRRDG